MAGAPIAWLELEPLTGRTHQLRVHCAAQGWPILGDPIYGARGDARRCNCSRAGRRAAAKTNPPIVVEAPAPPHMLEALGCLRLWRRCRREDLVKAGAAFDCAAQQIVKGSSEPFTNPRKHVHPSRDPSPHAL